MILSNLVKLAKSHGLVFRSIYGNSKVGYALPNAHYRDSVVIRTGMTKAQLMAKIEYMLAEVARDAERARGRKARNRRKMLAHNVIQGGRWHNLPAQPKGKLSLVA
jgi:hypothetical protein